MGFSLASAFEFDRFLASNLIISITAVLLARRMRKRSQLFSLAGRLWLLSVSMIFSFNLIRGNIFDHGTVFDLMTTFVFLFAIAVIVVGILPLLESLFGLLTIHFDAVARP